MTRRRVVPSVVGLVMIVGLAGGPTSAQLPGVTTAEPEVIDPGAAPRQLLRYHWVEGQSETMAMDMTVSVSGEVGGVPIVDVTTLVSAEAELTISEVYEDGSVRAEMVFTKYDIGGSGDATEAAGLAEITEAMVGLTGWQITDARGRILELDYDLPPDFPDELRQSISGSGTVTQPLPEEPVGVGARWVASGATVSQGLPVQMHTETEVLELDEEGAVLGLTLSLDVDLASALLGQVPPGVELTVDSYKTDGGGRGEVDFGDLVPMSDASVTSSLFMTVAGVQDGEPMELPMSMEMSMDMSVRPVE